MKTAKLTVTDEVNVCLTGVTDDVHKALAKFMRKFEPTAVHSPQFKLKRWDGYVHFYSRGWTFINLIDEGFLDILTKYGYGIEFVDQRQDYDLNIEPIREDSFSHLVFDGEPLMFRDYQVAATNLAFTNRCGIFEMATGSGKSLSAAATALAFSKHGKVMVIVPRIDLVLQLAATFRAIGIERVGEFYGAEKIVEQVTITTWQSLKNYPEILDGVLCFICDECHEYKAKEVHTLLTVAAKKVPFRFGYTATVPKAEIDLRRLMSSMGDVLFTIRAYELQEEGVLASCDINLLQYQEPKSLSDSFADYAEEFKYLTNNDKRREHIAEYISELASSTGNTLVLLKNINNGKKLAELIPGAVFMSGTASGKKRSKEYKSVQASDNQVLICTDGIASTGIDIPRLYNVVLIDPGKNFIKVLQMVGRGLRKYSDKAHVNIHDISANLKYSKKHMMARRKTYNENKYPNVLIPVHYR